MGITEGPVYFCDNCALVVRYEKECPRCHEEADDIGWIKTVEE